MSSTEKKVKSTRISYSIKKIPEEENTGKIKSENYRKINNKKEEHQNSPTQRKEKVKQVETNKQKEKLPPLPKILEKSIPDISNNKITDNSSSNIVDIQNPNKIPKLSDNAKEVYPVKFDIGEIDVEINSHGVSEKEQLEKIKFKLRILFLRKVFAIASFQLLLTIGIGSLSLIEPVKSFSFENYYMLGFSLAFILGILLFVAFKPKYAKRVPINYLLLLFFTISVGFLVLFLSSLFNPLKILLIWGCILFLKLSVCLMSYIFKEQFKIILAIAIIFVVTVISSIVLLILSSEICGQEACLLYVVFSSLGGILFGVYLVFYVKETLAQKEEVDTDGYIISSIEIYSNIILMFISLLCSVSE